LNIEELLEQTYDGYLTNGKGDFWHSVEEAREAIFGEPEEDPLYEFHAESTIYGVERVNFQIDYLKIVRFIKVKSLFDFEKELKDLLYFELYELLELSYDHVDFSLKGEDEFIKEIFTLAKRCSREFFLVDSVKKIVDRFNAQNQHIWLMDVGTTLQAKITNENVESV
jgi:hypothetical protein